MKKLLPTDSYATRSTSVPSFGWPSFAAYVISALLVISGCADLERTHQTGSETTSPSEGVIVAERIQLSSAILGENREILIATPEGYLESDARYPVLYLLDGKQNLPHVLGSVDILTRTGGMPPTIIVGIVGADRDRDYSTSQIESIPTSGGAPRFLSFLEEELIPFVDKNYRTMPFKILEGHSLGGSLTTHALISNTDLFDAHIIMSPALWWDDRELLSRAATFFQDRTSLPKTVFLGIGTEDGYEMRQDLGNLADIIANADIPDLRWAHYEYDREGHMSAPLQINYFGLRHVYADMRLSDALLENFQADAFLAHENYIREKYGAQAKQTGEAYVRLGFRLIADEKYDDAVVVLTRNAQAYPDWYMSYAWLADALEKQGDLRAALNNYQRATDLAAKNGAPISAQFQENIERITGIISDSD